jgi:SPP1 gp7 family putative phage head morphogenesis protein
VTVATEALQATTIPPVFSEAVRWFRGRVPLTDDAFARLTADAQRRAFWFAGGAVLSAVTDVWAALDRTLSAGGTIADFKATVAPTVLAQWQGSVANPAWRMELIFRNATQRAYSFGRVEQLRDPAVAAVRPFWFFDAIGDARTSEICKALDGTVLPATDPWWSAHTPPCHHACRSVVRGLRAGDRRVRDAAGRPPPLTAAQQGFGVLPDAADWRPRQGDYPPEVWQSYQGNRALRPEVQ